MPTLVGIDEAGYGPLLGPLTVGATVWHVGERHIERALSGLPDADPDLWNILAKAVTRRRSRDDFRLEIDDSKRVFDQKHGVGPLERTILAIANVLDFPHGRLGEFLNAIAGPAAQSTGAKHDCAFAPFSNRASSGQSAAHPWYARLDRALPIDVSAAAYGSTALRLAQVMNDEQCRCAAMLLQVVPERDFNQRVAQTRNKAAIIVEQVLRLVTRVLDARPESPVFFFVDRLGGRSDYRGLLQTAFPDRHLKIERLDDNMSRYRLAPADGETPRDAACSADWIFDFSVGADSRHLPVALAGMVCKYVRELLMLEFNEFWRRFEPALRPTAGYYTDAQRFLAEIEPHLPAAGMTRADFVRAR